MKTFNKYSIIDLYIKSLDVNIKYKVIAGIEEFGILLYKNLCNANIKVDYIFDDYNYINNQNLQELNFISLEDLKKISDNTLVLISDRDPEIFQKVYKKLKTKIQTSTSTAHYAMASDSIVSIHNRYSECYPHVLAK